jgi:hypothetical protein
MCSLDKLGPKHGQVNFGSESEFYKFLSEQISYCDDSFNGKSVAPNDSATISKYVEDFSTCLFRHYSSLIEQLCTCKESKMLAVHIMHYGDLFQELIKADFKISV